MDLLETDALHASPETHPAANGGLAIPVRRAGGAAPTQWRVRRGEACALTSVNPAVERSATTALQADLDERLVPRGARRLRVGRDALRRVPASCTGPAQARSLSVA
jgi:hypothetical protein